MPRRGSGGYAAAAFVRAGARGDALEAWRVRERKERGKCSKVGAFTPAWLRTTGWPWRSRPMFTATERTKALAAEDIQARIRGRQREHARGPKGPVFTPRARALRQPRDKGHGGAASGLAGFGARGKRSQRLDLATQTACARARARGCV
jgi:hypothetical protein